METTFLVNLIETLHKSHPSKIRISSEQFIAAKRSTKASDPAIRLLIGVHNLDSIHSFYADRARVLNQLPEGVTPLLADQVQVAANLLPGEIWLDGFFRVNDLEELLALPTVFSLEAASARLP
jgi:hypothetical protein